MPARAHSSFSVRFCDACSKVTTTTGTSLVAAAASCSARVVLPMPGATRQQVQSFGEAAQEVIKLREAGRHTQHGAAGRLPLQAARFRVRQDLGQQHAGPLQAACVVLRSAAWTRRVSSSSRVTMSVAGVVSSKSACASRSCAAASRRRWCRSTRRRAVAWGSGAGSQSAGTLGSWPVSKASARACHVSASLVKTSGVRRSNRSQYNLGDCMRLASMACSAAMSVNSSVRW